MEPELKKRRLGGAANAARPSVAEPPAAMNMFATNSATDTDWDQIVSYTEPSDRWDEIQTKLPDLIAALPPDRPASLQYPGCKVQPFLAARRPGLPEQASASRVRSGTTPSNA